MNDRSVFDLHADLLSKLEETGTRRLDGPGTGHIDIARARRGGLADLVCSLYTRQGARERTADAWKHVQALLAIYDELLAAHPAELAAGRRTEGAADAPAALRLWLSVENGVCLEGDLARLELLAARGLRLFQPVHNGCNELGQGALGGDGEGLTDLGRAVLVRCEALGVLPDLSHIGPRGFDDALAATAGPVVVSHANARAVCDHPRNLSDAQLRAVAARGGVVGLCFYPPFLTSSGRAAIDDVLRHAEHMLEVMGPAHIAIGSDFDGIETTPDGLADASCYGVLADGLRGLGLSQGEVAAIMGANARRLLSPDRNG